MNGKLSSPANSQLYLEEVRLLYYYLWKMLAFLDINQEDSHVRGGNINISALKCCHCPNFKNKVRPVSDKQQESKSTHALLPRATNLVFVAFFLLHFQLLSL